MPEERNNSRDTHPITAGVTEGDGDIGADSLKLGYEGGGVNVKGLGIFLIAFILFAIVIHVGIWFLTLAFLHQASGDHLPQSAVIRIDSAPQPPLQPMPTHDVFPAQDLHHMRAAENAIFERMGWAAGPGELDVQVPESILKELAQRVPVPATGPTTNAYEIPYTPETQPTGVAPAISSETRETPQPYGSAAAPRFRSPSTVPGGEP